MGSLTDMDCLLSSLRQSLSKSSTIILEEDAEYKPSMERWGNIDIKFPGAVIQPTSESDVVTTVREALQAGVPFVPTIGGHSPWSTIDKKGIIIDLRKFKEIEPNEQNHTVKVRGGVLMKELQLALFEKNEFTTVANGSTVGVIPYMLGGGITVYSPLVGYGCENILAARMINAKGDVVTVSESENSELLWAMRGAGQFFGLVLELTIRTYPLSVISHDGTRRMGNYFFPPERAVEVCQVVADIVDKNDHVSAGHIMILNNPITKVGQVLIVSCQYYGSKAELEAKYKPLADLQPFDIQIIDCDFKNHSDHLTWMMDKQGYKRFSQTGMANIHAKNFGKLVDLFLELENSTTGMERSMFMVEWHTPTQDGPALQTPTAFGFKDTQIWLNVFTWYQDSTLHDISLEYERRAVEIVRAGTLPEKYIAFPNTSREDPIDYRYKDAGTVDRLRQLKRTWDPNGVFTTELL